MRLLLDENLSDTVTRRLRDAGFSSLHVLDAGLGSESDERILAFARRKRFTIVTHDKDFGNLIRSPLQRHYGVILLRFRNQRPNNVAPHLIRFLEGQKNLKDRLVILREGQRRIV